MFGLLHLEILQTLAAKMKKKTNMTPSKVDIHLFVSELDKNRGNNCFLVTSKRLHLEMWNPVVADETYVDILTQLPQLEHLRISPCWHGDETFGCIDGSKLSELTSLTSIRTDVPIRNLKALTNLKRLSCSTDILDDKLDIEEFHNETIFGIKSPLKLPKLKVLACFTHTHYTYMKI